MRCRSKFRFLQDREYVCARRVWSRPGDGGCYALSKPCSHPAAQLSPGSATHVTDHASGFRISAAHSAQGLATGWRDALAVYVGRVVCCELSFLRTLS